MVTVLEVGQWQGSSSPKALGLVEGARWAGGFVPGERVVVPVRGDGGVFGEGVKALDVLVENVGLVREALAVGDGPVVTVGGDCGVDLAPIAAARERYGDELTVLWLDAHPDVNRPETLPSGSFHGMVVATLLGDGAAALVPEHRLKPEQVILVGVRAYEPGEREYVESRGVRLYGVPELERAVDGISGPVYVHLDLDVLDPEHFDSVSYPVAGGVTPDRLVELLRAVGPVVGGAITEYVGTGDPKDAAVIRRLGAALVG
ncbi:arginase family protein [Kribbella sp. NPDC056951]|uniref:arginase family protein n=1 Tax=Kribbella sp. NPDC056951 TaxID=3345978 RepID=UPI00364047BA